MPIDLDAPEAPPTPDALLIPDTVAAKLAGCSRATWLRLRAAGKIPPSIRLGRKVLWRRDEIVEWIGAGCPDARTWAAMAAARGRGTRPSSGVPVPQRISTS
jgi:predicted DNA-binding transcriptional regulator AlpA